MSNKERKRQYVYEALVILGVLALLTFICRLWPILLLIILGIFAAVIRLLFLSSKHVEVLVVVPLQDVSKKDTTEYDVCCLAYSVISKRITELVTGRYPEARWVWESPDAMQHIELGEDVYISLNRAGGYRRARVQIQNLQIVGFEFQKLSSPSPAVKKVVWPEPVTQSAGEPESATQSVEEPETVKQPVDDSEPEQENYELLAFEWVEANIMDLNKRCNEVIGKKESEIILTKEELPVKDSWPDICKELSRAGLKDVQCMTEGIKINLPQCSAERECF